jgi:uncharacterized circularly permuted ATP-grasp superfamily protein/uncharacterized alpha-E superfamily protein
MSLAAPNSGGSSVTGRLTESYHPPAGAYDELFGEPGVLRPQWQRFFPALKALGSAELERRWEGAKRLIYENGIAYNVDADPQTLYRPWELDPVPLLISPGEWQTLSEGLVQRARLLNMVLVDLYGPQKLLSQGLVPPELVFAHSGFLRNCHNLHVPRDVMLHLYAAHLARSADGRWHVLADRTQAPAGAGFALENRIIISRMLPNIFHDCQAQRLASFFMALRETLQELARQHRENPRIVLLSHGPQNSTYFEDAYLARYLGYTLVTGGDLAVRDNRVYLKTLGGLLSVDVILRRLNDDDCDPLELRSDSILGVAGLVQAARSGNVVIANALGSGLLEAPAWMAFLPALSQHLLGEPLKLPSAPAWWCGRPDDLRYVLENLSRLVIKPAFSARAGKPLFGDQLSADELARLAQRIRAQPRDFVAQERVYRSCAPVWSSNGLAAWHVALRAFLVSSGDSYNVMPGGLSRVSTSQEISTESVSAGEGGKDVWVLSDGPVKAVTLLHPAGQPIALRRSGNELPSRVADNLYWLGRQVERAEGAARLLRSMLSRVTSESEPENMPELRILMQAAAGQAVILDGPAANGELRPEQLEEEIFAMIFEGQRPGSLRSTLTAMSQAASIVRDRISLDSWRILSRIDQDVRWPTLPRQYIQAGDVLTLLNQVIINLAAFSGLGMESMTRTQAWRFLDMGRRLERSLHTCSLLKNTLVAAIEDESPLLEALLEIADSSMTYRARYLTTLQLAPVVDLLLSDESNPRSIGFQLAALETHVESLPHDTASPVRSSEQRIMLSALTSLRLAEVESLCETDRDQCRDKLDRLLTRMATHLRNLSDSLARTYLIHAGPSRQMSDIKPVGQL